MAGDTEAERSVRVTNQDLDRRVGHVEAVQEAHGIRIHELANSINVIGLKVEHSQEMIRVRFSGLEALVETVVAKLDTLAEKTTSSQVDPSSTPAGRQLLEDLEELRTWQRHHQPTIDSARSVMNAWKIIAGGSLLTTVAAVVALLVALGVVGR